MYFLYNICVYVGIGNKNNKMEGVYLTTIQWISLSFLHSIMLYYILLYY